MFSILILSMPLKAKERKGADLIIQRTDGTQVRGELIAVKEKSLLLLERDSISEIGSISLLQSNAILQIIILEKLSQNLISLHMRH